MSILQTASRRIEKGHNIPSARPSVVPDVATICHPVWRFGVGGLERQLLQTINGLTQPNMRHVLMVRGWNQQSETLAASLDPRTIIVSDDQAGRDYFWADRLHAILQEHRVNVLHIRGFSLLIDSLRAAERYGQCATCFSFHGFEAGGVLFTPMRRKVYREAVMRCYDRWAVSASAREAITSRLDLPLESFEVIRNGVDAECFQPSSTEARVRVRQQLGLPVDRTLVLSVGNIKPIKGHAVLLKAIAQLKELAPATTFALVGEVEADSAFPASLDALGEFDIRMIGPVQDVAPWYNAADVFVLPSLFEGMSNALLEAMASGLPVIATRVGGNVDALDGGVGMLVEPGDPIELANAIRSMMCDGDVRADYASRSRERVIAGFDKSRTLIALREKYLAMLAERMTIVGS